MILITRSRRGANVQGLLEVLRKKGPLRLDNRQKKEMANRAYPREQAFGDALDADKLEQL